LVVAEVGAHFSAASLATVDSVAEVVVANTSEAELLHWAELEDLTKAQTERLAQKMPVVRVVRILVVVVAADLGIKVWVDPVARASSLSGMQV
jgi:hypothetical protein